MCTFFQTGREEERNNNNNNNKATTTTSTKYMRFHGFLLFCTHKILWSWILLKFCTAVGFFFTFFLAVLYNLQYITLLGSLFFFHFFIYLFIFRCWFTRISFLCTHTHTICIHRQIKCNGKKRFSYIFSFYINKKKWIKKYWQSTEKQLNGKKQIVKMEKRHIHPKSNNNKIFNSNNQST